MPDNLQILLRPNAEDYARAERRLTWLRRVPFLTPSLRFRIAKRIVACVRFETSVGGDHWTAYDESQG